MPNDEEQIRQLVATWMDATEAGDTSKVLDLMTDDVVFLIPGRPPMHKSEFAAAAKAQAGQNAPRIGGQSEIQEIKVIGDWAFMWTKLSVTMTLTNAPPIQRAGHTLTILKKENGRWLLARDANLLAPVTGTQKQ